ncbi:hypothetical protein GYMLUDRAFT_244345 [Collybiopsis luxurians FD-317 M1]|uniref:ADF-H domain-containing protein n=1 Tax=Collybiopsis luxurians FD-317 M1 TaxID=944289 RepID=A0A0D0B9J4_9AGAR|nr:hypothetical protein GYMLUDRAFT_244345 [Collybiopsis luxurians FD-317 M1]
MATVNISDVDAVTAAYDSVVNLETNWFLLRYGVENTDDLFLYASGSKGFAELKQSFEDLSVVHIAFYHEESSQVPSKPGFALINYIPTSISGVRRARALVQSRRVGALFLKASLITEHATLTVDDLSNLTPFAIHQAVLKPEAVHNIRIERSVSSPPPIITSFDPPPQPPSESMIIPVRRSFTETYNPTVTPPNYSNTTSPSKSPNLFSSLLRRHRAKTDIPWESDGDEPVPPSPPPKVPPKDRSPDTSQHNTPSPRPRAITIPGPDRRESFADFAFISHPILSSDDEVLVDHPSLPAPVTLKKPEGALFTIPIDPKWTQESFYIPDPEERARRRRIAQEQRELEERQVRQEEVERQERRKREKEELKRLEEEEEAWRKAVLEQELREITAQRREKERREKEEDERKKYEIEMRKEADRKRRMKEHEKQEKWRQQLAREAEAEKRKEAETRKRLDAVRKIRVGEMTKEVQKEVKSTGSATAWATVQTTDNLVWRRRYIKLIGSKIFLYRSPKDMNQILDEVELRGQIAGLREPSEGFEELKAISHSFAIEFKDGREPWSVFGDTEEEKIKMLGILHYAAGL